MNGSSVNIIISLYCNYAAKQQPECTCRSGGGMHTKVVIAIFLWMYYQGSPQGIAGGRGLGGVCDHINRFGYHIKEIWLLC